MQLQICKIVYFIFIDRAIILKKTVKKNKMTVKS